MASRYLNVVLTIIAIALSLIAVRGFMGDAAAQFSCGSPRSPCYIDWAFPQKACGSLSDPCYVRVER